MEREEIQKKTWAKSGSIFVTLLGRELGGGEEVDRPGVQRIQYLLRKRRATLPTIELQLREIRSLGTEKKEGKKKRTSLNREKDCLPTSRKKGKKTRD